MANDGYYGIAGGINRAYDRIADQKARDRRLDNVDRRTDLMEDRGQRDQERLQSQLGLQAVQKEVAELSRDKMVRDAETEDVKGALQKLLRGDMEGAMSTYNKSGKDRLYKLKDEGGGIYSAVDARGQQIEINPYVWADKAGIALKEGKGGTLSVLTAAESESAIDAREHRQAGEIQGQKDTAAMERERVKAKATLGKAKSSKKMSRKEAVKEGRTIIFAGTSGLNFTDSPQQKKDRTAKLALYTQLIDQQAARGEDYDPGAASAKIEQYYRSEKQLEEEARKEVESEASYLKSDEQQFGGTREEEIKKRVADKKAEMQRLIANIGEEDAAAAQAQYQEGQTATGPNGEKIVFQNGQWVPVQ
jgi:hypothetical protein